MQPALVIMRTNTGTQLLRSNVAAARVLQGAISERIAPDPADEKPNDTQNQSEATKRANALRSGTSLVVQVSAALRAFKAQHCGAPLVLVRARRAEHAKFVAHIWAAASLPPGNEQLDSDEIADALTIPVGGQTLDIIPVSEHLEVEKDKGVHLVFLAAENDRARFTTERDADADRDVILLRDGTPLLHLRDADFAGSLRWMFGTHEVVLKRENGVAAPSLLNVAV